MFSKKMRVAAGLKLLQQSDAFRLTGLRGGQKLTVSSATAPDDTALMKKMFYNKIGYQTNSMKKDAEAKRQAEEAKRQEAEAKRQEAEKEKWRKFQEKAAAAKAEKYFINTLKKYGRVEVPDYEKFVENMLQKDIEKQLATYFNVKEHRDNYQQKHSSNLKQEDTALDAALFIALLKNEGLLDDARKLVMLKNVEEYFRSNKQITVESVVVTEDNYTTVIEGKLTLTTLFNKVVDYTAKKQLLKRFGFTWGSGHGMQFDEKKGDLATIIKKAFDNLNNARECDPQHLKVTHTYGSNVEDEKMRKACVEEFMLVLVPTKFYDRTKDVQGKAGKEEYTDSLIRLQKDVVDDLERSKQAEQDGACNLCKKKQA